MRKIEIEMNECMLAKVAANEELQIKTMDIIVNGYGV